MKTTVKLFTILFALFAFVACSEDDPDTPPVDFTVTSISQESGTVGTEITITGTNFPDVSDISLTFAGTPATITSATSTQIVVNVPTGATSGAVVVSANGVTREVTDSFTILADLVSGTMENLFAPQVGGQGQGEISGEFTKFSFATGDVTTSDTEWDIAFRGTTIAVNGGDVTGTNDEPARNGNGGAFIQTDALFTDVTTGGGLTYEQDGTGAFAIPTGSDNGWYNYNFMTNVVSPLPGVILVFQTHDGKYAKIEILSYYENAPATPDGFVDAARYYTFNYVYNPNDGETNLAAN